MRKLIFIAALSLLTSISSANEKEKVHKVLSSLDYFAKHPEDISLRNIEKSLGYKIFKSECRAESPDCDITIINNNDEIKLILFSIQKEDIQEYKKTNLIFEIDSPTCITKNDMSSFIHIQPSPFDSLPSAPLQYGKGDEKRSYENFVYFNEKNKHSRIYTQSVNGCVRVITFEGFFNKGKS